MIRLRQELTKRLDVVIETGTEADAAGLAGRLAPEFAAVASNNDGSALRNAIAARTAERFPIAHLRSRAPETLPCRDQVLQLAQAALRGDWSVFGHPIHVGGRVAWTSHPITGAPTDVRHWHRVRYMGGINGGDVKFLWELNRHSAIVRLAQGYFLTHDDDFAARAVELLDDWGEQNPPSRGINWTSSLEVGFRAIAWCWIWALTRESPAWTGPRLSRFLSSLWHHARHIERYDSTHHSPNTHLTGEALALAYVGTSFPAFRRSAAWTRRGVSILSSELGRQVLDDGMHFERSVGYHRYTAEFYLHLLLLCRSSGIPAPAGLADRLRAMLDATAAFQRPDGGWPVIGDEDSGSTLLLAPTDAQDQRPLLASGAGLFANSGWLESVGESALSGVWWLLDDPSWHMLTSARATLGVKPTTAIDAVALPVAGYYVVRERGVDDGWHCIVDAGPHGGDRTGHAHTDLGHVEISQGTTRVVGDPGCSGYTIDPQRRDWYRSEQAHACLVVRGAPLAIPAGAFSWSRIAPTPSADVGKSEGLWWCELAYERFGANGRLTHRRQIVLVPRWGVVVMDWVLPSGAEHVSLHWPLVDPSSELLETGVRTGRHSILWTWASSARPEGATLDRSLASPSYGREVPASTLRLAYTCDTPTWLVTAFAGGGASIAAMEHSSSQVRCDMGSADGGTAIALVLEPSRRPVLGTNPIVASTFRTDR